MLSRAGINNPPRDAGLLPFHIVELYQRLLVEWQLWRAESTPEKKRWIEQRILSSACAVSAKYRSAQTSANEFRG